MKQAFQISKSKIKSISYICIILITLFSCNSKKTKQQDFAKPNFLIVLTDQWRADAFGHRGNPDVLTPNIDKLAGEGVQFVNAISGMPVCTPARASLLTGQRPLTNGVFMNDVQLDTTANSLAKIMTANNYQTAYIGKWHLDGRGRGTFIPKGRRQGFEYWKAQECTHNYNNSKYYSETPDTLLWKGYDAIAQTKDACDYIRNHANEQKPFLMFLSFGPPHAPYQTAPEKYRQLYSADKIHLNPNVPDDMKEQVQKDFAGYYAHCTALDDMVGQLRKTLHETGADENTIVIFLSDHGDLLGSHGAYKKQQPLDESIRVPMIFYIPEKLGGKPAIKEAMINMEDVLPTILGFSSIEIPETVEGINYCNYINGGENPGDTVTLISCVQPFGQWSRKKGGREYRGLRSTRYTYVRDINGPWLFFDNKVDPFQMNNLIANKEYLNLAKSFDSLLIDKLEKQGDKFLSGLDYVEQYNYPPLNSEETVPY